MYTEFDTPKGKRPLGIPRRRWEDNIKNFLNKIRAQSVGSLGLG